MLAAELEKYVQQTDLIMNNHQTSFLSKFNTIALTNQQMQHVKGGDDTTDTDFIGAQDIIDL